MTPPGYASSTSTLAYSSPPSPVYMPPEYARDGGDGVYPGALYHSDTGSTMREKMAAQKKVDEPIIKKKSLMKLLTSIIVGIMVCLIVAAVVGKIRASPTPSAAPTATVTATAAPAVTLIDGATPTTPTATITEAAAAATPTATISSSSSSTSSAPATSGTSVAKYACPYVQEPRKRAAAAKLCKLVAQTDDQKKDSPSIIDTHTWHMDGCTVERSSYNGKSGEPLQFRCAVTCPGSGKAGTEVDNTFACA